MQADIHPNYKKVEVICSCGNQFFIKSTYKSDTLRPEVCSSCHPFYTGKHKIVDTAGRVDLFMRKYAKQAEAAAAPKVAVKATKAKTATKAKAKAKTPKE